MIKNILKGFIIGIGKIMPGVSGSMLAISLGVYEKMLAIIADIRHITIAKFSFLFTVLFGSILSISLFSGTVKWFLDSFYFPIMLLFIGLIIGGIPEIISEVKKQNIKIKNIIIFIIALTFSYMFTNLGALNIKNTDNIFIYFSLGLIEAFSSTIPGISGTAIYMSLGVYETLLDFFSNIFNPEYFKFGIFFAVGILTGVMIIAKTITYLLNKYKIGTYYAILGFMTSSIVIMFKVAFIDIFTNSLNGLMLIELFLGLFFLILGYKITMKINVLLSKN